MPPEDVCVLTDERGAVTGRVRMRGGRLDGPAEFYGGDGALIQRGHFREGEPHGALELYEAGRLRMVIRYVAGKQDGEAVTYAGSGAVCGRTRYAGGRRNGPAEWYDAASGRLLRTETYRDDLLEGEVVDYFPSGEVRERSRYRAGLLDGERVTLGEDGAVQRRVEYREGQEVAAWTPPPPAPPDAPAPAPVEPTSLWKRVRRILTGGR